MITGINMMVKLVKRKDGMGVVEIVLIIAVLVALALIFRNVIIEFVQGILQTIVGVRDTFDPTRP